MQIYGMHLYSVYIWALEIIAVLVHIYTVFFHVDVVLIMVNHASGYFSHLLEHTFS